MQLAQQELSAQQVSLEQQGLPAQLALLEPQEPLELLVQPVLQVLRVQLAQQEPPELSEQLVLQGLLAQLVLRAQLA